MNMLARRNASACRQDIQDKTPKSFLDYPQKQAVNHKAREAYEEI
jgi:hypothetical protein